MVNWCGHECLRIHDNLAHVRVQVFIEKVRFAIERFNYRST